MKWVFIFLQLILILSCNTNNTSGESKKDSSSPIHTGREEKDTTSGESKKTNNDWGGCYWKLMQRDSFVLHLETSNNEVTGKLSFNNFQKDKSSGRVYGKVEDDILKLWYSFQSEGMQSVMEVYFQKR